MAQIYQNDPSLGCCMSQAQVEEQLTLTSDIQLGVQSNQARMETGNPINSET